MHPRSLASAPVLMLLLATLAAGACTRADGPRDPHETAQPETTQPGDGVEPGDAPTPAPKIEQVVAGWSHACLRTADREAWCWGELTFDAAHKRPERVDFGGPVVQLAAGGEITCALLDGGAVACRDYDELQRIEGIDDAVAIGVQDTGRGVCAVRQGGTLVCRQYSGAAAVAGLSDVVAVDGGQGWCALRETGEVMCWGYSLDIFGLPPAKAPVATPLRDVESLTVAMWHACARTRGGEVVCAGTNYAGQLGNGERDGSPTGVPVALAAPVRSLASNYTRTVAVDGRGRVQWWGNIDDSSGHGPPKPSEPVAIAGVTDAVEAVTGTEFGCARTSAGTVSCWGDNDKGQLGDGTTESHAEARPIVWPIVERETSVDPSAPRTDAGVTVGAMTIETPRSYGSSDHTMSVVVPITYDGERPGETVLVVARCEVEGDVLVDSVEIFKPFGFKPGEAFTRNDSELFSDRELALPPSRCELYVGMTNEALTRAGPLIATACWDRKAVPWGRCAPPLAATSSKGAEAIEVTKVEASQYGMDDEARLDLSIIVRLAAPPDPAARLAISAACETRDGARHQDLWSRPLAVPFGAVAGDGVVRSATLFDETAMPGYPSRCSVAFRLQVGDAPSKPVAHMCWQRSAVEMGAPCAGLDAP